ncbi:MAG TPA: glycosyltransferase family 4 protein [Patescibacteria group bacterium]|nr:glycosyltransferase family 4 protein [Patescibacteria group bacterium]
MKQLPAISNISEKRVAYLSTYPPRECGIATFTKDLLDAANELNALKPPAVIALNEKETIYNYDKRVKWQIERDCVDDYVQAARFANSSDVDLVNIQHEFGLFGGEYGDYINHFLDNVEKPVVTTLHTVQPNFDPKAKAVLRRIAAKSASIVVIARLAIELLEKQGIVCKKVAVIPHGCPDIPFVPSEIVKASLGLKDRFVLSTFGLISRGKGIEYAIRALPYVIDKEPRIIYLIIGETHPEVRKTEGENYRKKLMRLVEELHLEKHVRFHNRFLTKRELIKYLQATDVYLTPYTSPNQISSGPLVYALGTGRAVISTPYLHAQEVLAGGQGLFCKFKDANSVAACIEKLLDENLRWAMQRKAYKYSRKFVWSNVAKEYLKLFKRIIKS